MAPLLIAMGSLSLGETSRFNGTITFEVGLFTIYTADFNGTVTFEVGLYTIPNADSFDAFVWALGVGYDYMTPCFHFIGSGLGTSGILPFSLITNLTGRLGKLFLHPIQGQFGVLTVCECFPEVLHYFLE